MWQKLWVPVQLGTGVLCDIRQVSWSLWATTTSAVNRTVPYPVQMCTNLGFHFDLTCRPDQQEVGFLTPPKLGGFRQAHLHSLSALRCLETMLGMRTQATEEKPHVEEGELRAAGPVPRVPTRRG